MNREEIKQLLPHREPMLLVDWTEGNAEGIRATYHVTGEEFFVQGHFPGFPVVPGVILCEIMAQCENVLSGMKEVCCHAGMAVIGLSVFYAILTFSMWVQVRPTPVSRKIQLNN